MLSVVTASRFETLEQHLLDGLMQAGGEPFSLDTVVVPSAAVRRRLTLAVADRHGVCSQIEFPFLAEWLWCQVGRLVPGVATRSPYDPALLRWRIEAGLADPALTAEHPRLARWLATADAAMRFALAERLAGLFSQYLTWRPDWLAAWQAGGVRATRADEQSGRADELWQAALWRRLQRDIAPSGEPRHPVEACLERLAAAPADDPLLAGLPARARVFCLPAMPPLYLELLCGLARRVDITLYVLNPCREYWFDLASAREHARRSLRGDAQHLEVGHRLLTAWGGQTQAWLALLYEREEAQQALELEEVVVPRPVSLLGLLQEGVRTLEDPAPGSLAARAQPDGSLEVHVCHSLLRELEVLHDRLLGWLAAERPPLASDILVVVPDLDHAAPLIAQVFGTASRELAIPWTISGLAPAATDPLAHALLSLLDLARGRMPLSAVLAVLEEAPVAECFGIDESAHELLGGLLQQAGIHWGLDAAQREACGLPASAVGTLRDGLERLWLAHALPEGHAVPWQEHLPGSPVAPPVALLEALHEFLERLDGLRERLATPLTPEQWQRTLEWCLAAFVPEGRAWRGARGSLTGELQVLLGQLREAAVERPLEVELLVGSLRGHLAGGAGGGVPGGAVTFAAMSSLRLLPARYLCVLGLDDGVFPAPRRPLEFDLMASHPRRGDRSGGEDQRNLFLDLLMAARDGLHLSYSGRSARDNSERPPSVVVAELIDVLVAALCPAEAEAGERAALRARLVCQHPLQPFDGAYFGGDGAAPRSHRRDLAAALAARAQALPARTDPVVAEDPADQADEADEAAQPDRGAAPFFTGALPPLDAAWREPPLERLIAFLQHPARALLRDRLGLRLDWPDAGWNDDEDFLPARGAPQGLSRHLLPLLREWPGVGDEDLLRRARAAADFPEGPLGEVALREELALLRGFAHAVATLEAALPAAPAAARLVRLPLQLPDSAWCLHGSLPGTVVAGAAQTGWEYANLDVRRELAVWLRHLWACALAPAPLRTTWQLRDTRLAFMPLDAAQAREQLTGLLALYARGMCRPLHFFPRSAAALLDGGTAAARRRWEGSHFGAQHFAGECEDPAWRLALRGVSDPLAGDFQPLAEQVLGPLRAARE